MKNFWVVSTVVFASLTSFATDPSLTETRETGKTVECAKKVALAPGDSRMTITYLAGTDDPSFKPVRGKRLSQAIRLHREPQGKSIVLTLTAPAPLLIEALEFYVPGRSAPLVTWEVEELAKIYDATNKKPATMETIREYLKNVARLEAELHIAGVKDPVKTTVDLKELFARASDPAVQKIRIWY